MSGQTGWRAVNSGLTNKNVRCLAINPLTPKIIYVGTENGIFVSPDRGSQWTQINSRLFHPVVTSIAVDPSNPETVYAGTDGGGVFKSTNGGQADPGAYADSWDDPD
jgi:photosystem II stability/assembly factor-like uncharacterized protein